MRALTHFSLLAIAFLVAARPRAIERRDAVSRPGEDRHLFGAAVSVPEHIVKRYPVVERSFAAVEPLQRLAPRYSKTKTESEFHLYY